jgi:hypothetical protein
LATVWTAGDEDEGKSTGDTCVDVEGGVDAECWQPDTKSTPAPTTTGQTARRPV